MDASTRISFEPQLIQVNFYHYILDITISIEISKIEPKYPSGCQDWTRVFQIASKQSS